MRTPSLLRRAALFRTYAKQDEMLSEPRSAERTLAKALEGEADLFEALARKRAFFALAQSRLISELQHDILLAVHRALVEPFARGGEHQQMVLLPHGVVGGTGEIDEHLVAPDIGVKIAH